VKGTRPTTASIDLGALAGNLAEAERLAAGRKVIAVVKADAYGHGAVPVARRLAAAGCARLAVVTLAEASELRTAQIDLPILVMGGVHDAAEAADAASLDVTAAVQRAGDVVLLARAAAERGTVLRVQVEVDTGMRRMGVPPEEAPRLLEGVAREPGLVLEGVYTHLACADEPDLASTRAQLALFAEVLRAMRSRGIAPGVVHVANSAALLAGPELAGALPAEVNAVRPGLMLYGVLPAPHLAGRARLAPVMSLRSRVCHVRHVREGEPVGYGATFRAPRRGRIATLPVGYADGVPWSLGGRGFVLLRGRPTPIAGRVSMDFVTLDVGEAPVEIGDEALLFGCARGAPEARLPVEEVAAAAGTIAYELLVRVGRRVPRSVEC
jgi:alanine racemase